MLFWHDTLLVVVIALAIDAIVGDPDWVWRRLPHPVTWIGACVGFLDHRLNRQGQSQRIQKLAGVATIALLTIFAFVVGLVITGALKGTIGETVVLGLVSSIFIAQRSLYQHVACVHAAFKSDGLDEARTFVAMIVGRDASRLDETAICRAAIESTAENFSDGIVAPVFWLALLGLPGLLAYKAINTADSMIGHRCAKYQWFGWAAARLDDLVNIVPARLSGAMIAFMAPSANGSIAASFRVMMREATHHRSPNAGWPESAMAGALGIALAGPRFYKDVLADDPFFNSHGGPATRNDITRALRVLVAACCLQAAIYVILALLF